MVETTAAVAPAGAAQARDEVMIQVAGLAKTYKTKRGTVDAVRSVDLTVQAGEIVGFLGPNGAGKTTTLRMLTTLLEPTAGTAVVAGADLRREPVEVRKRIGYVAQSGGTDDACTVAEELITQAELYRLDRAEARRRCALLLAQFDLAGLQGRQIKTLSGGQRRRLDIALGLVHRPRLVFLDEPSAGLDPQSRANLWTHIRRLRDELDTTVFLTTHYLDEADALCDRILIIDSGRIVVEGTPEALKNRIAGDLVTVETDGPGEDVLAALEGVEGIRESSAADRTVRVTVEPGGRQLLAITRALDAAQLPVSSIQLARPTLDDVFLTLTGRSLRDDSPSATAGDADGGDSGDRGADGGDDGGGGGGRRPWRGKGGKRSKGARSRTRRRHDEDSA